MKYVLDSSLAVKWVIAEPDSKESLALRTQAMQGVHTLLAPDIFPAEIAHALTKAERQGRITGGMAAVLWNDVMGTCPVLQPHFTLAPRAIELASDARIGFYDCLYVALAEYEGCELVTADERLISGIGQQLSFIIRLSDLP